MTLLVVVGVLVDASTKPQEVATGDESGLEFVTALDSSDHEVLSVHGDTVRVVRPERVLARAVDPQSPQPHPRPSAAKPFQRFRAVAGDEPAPARLFGGLVGVIEHRV